VRHGGISLRSCIASRADCLTFARVRGFAAASVVLGALLVACGDTVDNNAFLEDLHNRLPAEVTVQGAVTALLPDSNGSDGPHENFDVDISGVSVQIIHNLDLAPRVPVAVGDTVVVHGQFEPDSSGPIIHYTHHQTGSHEGGYITRNGQTYQ
jgi:uncharacterized protein DUF3465